MRQIATPPQRYLHFWVLLGPVVLLLTFFILLMRPHTSFVLPLVAIIGIPICWRWKMQGLILALLVLGVTIAFYFNTLPIEEKLWEAGLGFSVALSFVIMALGFEEVDSQIHSIQLESSSRLDNLLHVDGKFKALQKEYEEEFLSFHSDREAYLAEIAERDEQLRHSKKLSEIVYEELNAMHQIKEGLLEEIQLQQRELREEGNENYREQQEVKKQAVVQEMSSYIESLSRENTLLQHTLSKLQKELEETHTPSQ